jgi:hypothetical protein
MQHTVQEWQHACTFYGEGPRAAQEWQVGLYAMREKRDSAAS